MKTKKLSKIKKIIRAIFLSLLISLTIMLGITLIYICNCINEVKNIEVSLKNNTTNYSRIYDKDNNLICDFGNDNYVNLSSINDYTIDAFLSIEDNTFYKHNGINLKRICKAIIDNIRSKKIVSGASTISQQLIKNRYLTNKRSLKRKIQELYLTIKLEKTESKDKILESYLNSIYYGSGAYGIGNASVRYFNKDVENLDIIESCVLAGVINSPTLYNPILNYENAMQRKDLILQQMYKFNKIDRDTLTENLGKEIELNVNNKVFDNYDVYVGMAINEVAEKLNITKDEVIHGGYEIVTNQDSCVQDKLNQIINDDKYYPQNEYGNIADGLSIVADNNTNAIIACSSRSNYDLSNLYRQPGSLIKPIVVYAPALQEKLIFPCSKILDEKIDIDGYSPKNVGGKYYGYQSVYDCVAKSLNIPAVKLCNMLGIDKAKKYGEKCGLKFDEKDNGLAIALGGLTKGLTIQNIINSYYSLFCNKNMKNYSIIKNVYKNNFLITINNQMTKDNIFVTQTQFLINDILKYSTKYGTSKKLSNFDFDICSKTGTVCVKDSNYNTDAYSLAYTTSHIMCTWFGNYGMDKEYNLIGSNNGGTFATETIKDMFEFLYDTEIPKNFDKPKGIVSLPIYTTLEEEIVIADNVCSKYVSYELFDEKNLPTKKSSDIVLDSNSINYNVVFENNKVKIIFDALPNYIYKVYINNDLLKSFADCNGNIMYYVNDYDYNCNYDFKLNVEDMNQNILWSDTLSLTIPYFYNQLFNYSNYSYLFN